MPTDNTGQIFTRLDATDIARLDRVVQQRRYQRSRAAYLRQAVLEKLERDEAELAAEQAGRGRRRGGLHKQ